MPASRGFLEEIGLDISSGDWWSLPTCKGGVCLVRKVFQAGKTVCIKDGGTKNMSWWPTNSSIESSVSLD